MVKVRERIWVGIDVGKASHHACAVDETIHAATDNGLNDPNYSPFVDAIRLLLDAGAASGDLKPALDPEDVLLQLSVLWRIPPSVDAAQRADRILSLIVDGLLAHSPPSSTDRN